MSHLITNRPADLPKGEINLTQDDLSFVWEGVTYEDEYAAYGWIITVDHIDSGRKMGTVGPSDIAPEVNKILKVSGDHRIRFQMYDDDGELYYAGYLTFDPERASSDTPAFPLDDFGTPYAGCTAITYRDRPELDCS